MQFVFLAAGRPARFPHWPPLVAAAWLALAACASACGSASGARAPAEVPDEPLRPAIWAAPPSELPPAPESAAPAAQAALEPAPEAGPDQVVVYRRGEPIEVISRAQAEASGLFVLDLGSDWVPALFRSTPELPHRYEHNFVELANGRFDDGPEGRRAALDRYLEPHGIPPSLALLEHRFSALAERPCVRKLSLGALRKFGGATWNDGAAPPLAEAVVAALQARLACEGHLRGAPSGSLDEATRKALEEFERRNRIYTRASLRGETLEALRAEPLELERRTLLRVLTERAVLDLGIVEDGSGIGAISARSTDAVENAPNVIRRLQERILDALSLDDVAGTQRFYQRLAARLQAPHYAIAIDSIELPDYYARDMELWVEVDRGDLYYEFPFDEQGKPLSFPIERGPTMTLFARAGDSVRPLVQYPTTIGGWRVRRSDGAVFWQYKESQPGLRAWKRIVSAPVWLPPPSTPAETLIAKFRRTSDGSEFQELNYNLVGPSFASAYGLIAAHHQRARRGAHGELEVGNDDGMRTHGSSDYTSIWRTVSSGCHRLHNHLAMRLLHFVLAHRAHQRVGHLPSRFRLRVHTADFDDVFQISQTGYQFLLARPIEVHVLPGRIRGQLKHALKQRIPAAEDASSWPTIMVAPLSPTLDQSPASD